MGKTLEEYSTKELCEELAKRGGVSKVVLEPYEKKNLANLEGPMTMFLIID